MARKTVPPTVLIDGKGRRSDLRQCHRCTALFQTASDSKRVICRDCQGKPGTCPECHQPTTRKREREGQCEVCELGSDSRLGQRRHPLVPAFKMPRAYSAESPLGCLLCYTPTVRMERIPREIATIEMMELPVFPYLPICYTCTDLRGGRTFSAWANSSRLAGERVERLKSRFEMIKEDVYLDTGGPV